MYSLASCMCRCDVERGCVYVCTVCVGVGICILMSRSLDRTSSVRSLNTTQHVTVLKLSVEYSTFVQSHLYKNSACT